MSPRYSFLVLFWYVNTFAIPPATYLHVLLACLVVALHQRFIVLGALHAPLRCRMLRQTAITCVVPGCSIEINCYGSKCLRVPCSYSAGHCTPGNFVRETDQGEGGCTVHQVLFCATGRWTMRVRCARNHMQACTSTDSV
jgi:hypothetical protein